jgi:hypothetical protein
MGAEAGQSLEMILKRKELERQAGKGTFAWGIGNSLGLSPAYARQAIPSGTVDVLFSPMKTAPKAIDVAPAQLVLWLAYHSSEGGLVDLPGHMLITSRGGNASGTEKRTHYALLCERQDVISAEDEHGIIDSKYARNLVSLNPLGASQVTAMVRYDKPEDNIRPERPYPISFRARMYREGFVRLGMPVPLTGPLLSTYKALCQVSDADDWLTGTIELKRQARASLTQSQKQMNLFDF